MTLSAVALAQLNPDLPPPTREDIGATTMDPRLNLEPEDEHNRTLVANTHPPDWRNPEPASTYNLVVIGGGSAGLVAAAGAAGMGARVALVERHLLGGDCLNFGCVPSKALIRSAHVAAEIRKAERFGIRVSGDVEIDFAAIMERVRRVRADISPHDSARRFTDDYGVDVFLGDAAFRSPREVEVEGATLRFSKAVIATGARPAVPAIPGLAEAGFLTNQTVFNLTELPPRLIIVGGGPIGCELAQAFARLGSEVTIVEMADQFLPREDPDAARVIQGAMERDGVDVRLSTALEEVESVGSAKRLRLATPNGTENLIADEILVATGRVPNVDGLGLEHASVEYDRAGVTVNDFLQTTNPRIYASGDVCLTHKFTHVADATSRAIVQNAFFSVAGRKRVSRMVIPWATYTDPEIAHVGLYEHEARERGLDVATISVPMADVDRAITDGDEEGFLKVHLEQGSDRILGATIVARHAGEMISEITMAMVEGIGLGKIAGVIHPYPTQSEVIRRAADAHNRTRLTPRVASLMKRWVTLRR